jgi:AcrR family transcriptional regulator
MATEPAGKRRRMRPQERRALILEVARAQISENGVLQTSLRDIAAACGLSTGTLGYHFDGIAEILAEVLRLASEDFITQVMTNAQMEKSAADRLTVIVAANLPDNPGALAVWRLWLDYWAIVARDRTLQAVHAERYHMWREVCRQILAEAVAVGEIAPLDVEQVAAEFVGLFDGLILQAVVGDNEMDSARALTVLRGYLAATLRPPTPLSQTKDREVHATVRAASAVDGHMSNAPVLDARA